MKKTRIPLISVILVLIVILSCTGCADTTDSETAEAVNIAFVVGIADGESKINEGIDELTALPAQPGTDYAFISAEGTPTCIGEPGTIVDLSDRGYTDTMMERIRTGMLADLTARLENYVPSSAEIDMASAIQLGVRQLKANAVEGRKNILVFYCSGRSTTGLISMVASPLYKVDIEASVPAIAEKMDLDMASIVDEVIWYCCGECGGGQPALSSTEKTKMKEFYKELFVLLGMDESNIIFKDNLPSTEYYQFCDAPVSYMDVENISSGLKEFTPEIFEDADALQEPIVIPESQLQYKADSAEFLSPETAVEVIQPVVDYLLEYPVNILVYSTCAGDADCYWLSEARSSTVRDLITKGGVAESRVTIVNVKVADDPYYQFGLGIGEEASVNRKTVIIDASTELAQQLLQNAV